MSVLTDRLFAACAASGIALLDADKDAILGAADGLADDVIDRAVTAFADNLPAGGLKSVEFGPIKDALIASEPQFDQIVNDKIGALFDVIEGALKRAQHA